MSVFFNGRQWVSPATMSKVDDSAMYNRNPSVGNIAALIGKSTGGAPASPLRFGSASEARSVLRSGDLLTAVEKAFDASNDTAGPVEVVAFRADPATQGTYTFAGQGGANNLMVVSSSDYGAWVNNIAIKIEDGTSRGKKITTQFGNDFHVGDNLARDVAVVSYTGSGTNPGISVSPEIINLYANNATASMIDLSTIENVAQLVERINSVTDFSATLQDGSGDLPVLRVFETTGNNGASTSSLDAGATYTVTANSYEAVRWLNSNAEGFVDALLVDPSSAIENLANTTGFVYLTGGSDGAAVTADWQTCFDAMQLIDVQFVAPISASPAVHSMADTHCQFMSDVMRMERRCIVGTDVSTTDDDAIAAALALNSDRCSLVHLGFYDYDSTGVLVLRPPYIMAGLLAGMFSGVNPGTALTNKSINVNGLERSLRNPVDTDRLINGGVLAVESTRTGYRVVKSITTWLTNSNYNRVEVSVGFAADFVSRSVRDALDPLRGMKANAETLSEAEIRVTSALGVLALSEPYGPGVLAGDADNPAYRNIYVSIDGDVLRVEFECSPVIPINYIPIVVFAAPYSSTS